MTIYYEKVRKVSDLDANRASFNIVGYRGIASVNTVTNLDWEFEEERWLSGGVLLAKGTNWGDKLSIQLIDKNNVLGYGSNVVLGEHVTDFYMITDSEFQLKLEAPYIALIPEGVFIRIKYTSTSLVDPVEVAFNLITHIPKE